MHNNIFRISDMKLKIVLNAWWIGIVAILFLMVPNQLQADAVDWSVDKNEMVISKTDSDTLLLTEKRVKHWIKTRIAVAKLQNKMKASAGEYDDVVQAFFEERKKLLKSKGWAVEDFDEAKERINAAISAMDINDDLKESEENHQNEVAEIRANEFYSEKQKEEMIAALNELRKKQIDQFINPTKNDWPAVDPYREKFEQMTAWIAGNVENPPEL